jgi:hypothetical protein
LPSGGHRRRYSFGSEFFLHNRPHYFFAFFPPDFLPPEDLEAEDFFEEPPLDLLAEDFVDPPLDFFAEEDFPPFLGFWSWAGAPPPLGAEGGATGGGGGGDGLEMVRVATCRPW